MILELSKLWLNHQITTKAEGWPIRYGWLKL